MYEPIDDNSLAVTVTSDFFAHSVVAPTGLPRLVIDYGGAALVLDVADPWHAETFAIGLASSSLHFATQCRYLLGEPTSLDNY